MDYQSIPEMFFSKANEWPKRNFISFETTEYSYSQASEIVQKTAKVFKKFGVKKGTKVVILLNNSPEFVFSTLALLSFGAVAIPMNIFLKEGEASYIVNDSETEFIVTEPAFEGVIKGVMTNCKKIEHIFTFESGIKNAININDESEKVDDKPLLTKISPSDLAIFIYTSGTTGHPKGAMLTHENIIKNVLSYNIVLPSSQKDKFLVILPMFHTYTFSACIMFPISLGASMIILRSVSEMAKKSFKKILIFKRPTFILGVPQVFGALAKAPMPKWFIKFLYPIKYHVSGGAALSPETFEQFRKKFGKPVIEGYGLSEASPVISFNPYDNPKQGTVGFPLPGVKVKIVGEDDTELPKNTVGELIAKGPNIMQGYWRMPKATDDAIKNGWLFTGDMAKIDDDGYITIVDRKKDLIISKGMNVYPREIEEVIQKFENVDAAAVIGVPSPEHGEVISAYIQPKEGTRIDEAGLKNYIKKELANFKIPKAIHIIDNLPLTATGKVLKRKLKDMVKDGTLNERATND